jgi:hypothetical protein
MLAIITVFKVEVDSKESAFNAIKSMSSQFIEVGEVYEFSPRPGKLFDLLDVLKINNIKYTTKFDVSDEHVDPQR